MMRIPTVLCGVMSLVVWLFMVASGVMWTCVPKDLLRGPVVCLLIGVRPRVRCSNRVIGFVTTAAT